MAPSCKVSRTRMAKNTCGMVTLSTGDASLPSSSPSCVDCGKTPLESMERNTTWNGMALPVTPTLPFWPKARIESYWDCTRSEEHTSELQSRQYLVCRLLLEKKKKTH